MLRYTVVSNCCRLWFTWWTNKIAYQASNYLHKFRRWILPYILGSRLFSYSLSGSRGLVTGNSGFSKDIGCFIWRMVGLPCVDALYERMNFDLNPFQLLFRRFLSLIINFFLFVCCGTVSLVPMHPWFFFLRIRSIHFSRWSNQAFAKWVIVQRRAPSFRHLESECLKNWRHFQNPAKAFVLERAISREMSSKYWGRKVFVHFDI